MCSLSPLSSHRLRRLSVALAVLLPSLVNGSEAAPVAGLAPYERPAGAPVQRMYAKTPEWTQQATRGVVQPLPQGLKFLADQGAWYTPFNQPGMPGVYDLRNLHDNKSAAR